MQAFFFTRTGHCHREKSAGSSFAVWSKRDTSVKGERVQRIDLEDLDRQVVRASTEARMVDSNCDWLKMPADGNRQVEPSGSAKGRSKKAGASDRAGGATPGQERLIRAAHEVGLKPAAIAREFRLSRPAVQNVIKAAERDRRKTER